MNEKDKDAISGVAPQHPDWGKQQNPHAGDKPAGKATEAIQDREGRDPDLPGSAPKSK